MELLAIYNVTGSLVSVVVRALDLPLHFIIIIIIIIVTTVVIIIIFITFITRTLEQEQFTVLMR